jgi:hypothetical protein
MFLLRGKALGDSFLGRDDFGAETVPVGGTSVALRGYGVDGGVHFGSLGGFFREGLGMSCGFVGQYFDIFFLHALVLL